VCVCVCVCVCALAQLRALQRTSTRCVVGILQRSGMCQSATALTLVNGVFDGGSCGLCCDVRSWKRKQTNVMDQKKQDLQEEMQKDKKHRSEHC